MTTSTTDDTTRAGRFAKAMAADRQLRALDVMVRTLAALPRPGDTMCSGCVWSRILKPLALPLVGFERGTVPTNAEDPKPGGGGLRVYTGDELMAAADVKRTRAETDTERWLRSQEAWEAVTGTWIAILHEADPANGHGIGRNGRSPIVNH